LHDQLDKHKILQLIELLYKIPLSEWTLNYQTDYERLDRLMTESMLYAESRATKKYTNTFDWSPALVKTVFAERFGRLALRRSQGRPISDKLLHRTKASAGITVDPLQLTLPDVVQCLAAARQTRKEVQQRHQSLRKTYLEQLAEALVLKELHILRVTPNMKRDLLLAPPKKSNG
jgi:hypothetical protein